MLDRLSVHELSYVHALLQELTSSDTFQLRSFQLHYKLIWPPLLTQRQRNHGGSKSFMSCPQYTHKGLKLRTWELHAEGKTKKRYTWNTSTGFWEKAR